MSEQIRKEHLWTKPFIIILTLNLVATTATFTIMAIFPLYILYVGGSKFLAGLVTGIFTFTAFLVRPILGNLLDRRSRKAILFLGNVITLAVIVGYGNYHWIAVLFMLRIFQGIGWSAVSTATNTIASDLIPSARRFEGIGLFGVSNAIAMGLGPALGLYIVENYDYTILYMISGIFVLLNFGLAFILPYQDKHIKDANNINSFNKEKETYLQLSASAKVKKAKYKPVIFEKTAILPSLVLFFVAITYSSIVTFIPSYAADLGIKNIGLFFVMFAFSLLITRPTSGKMADRIGPTKVILPGMLFLFISLFLLAKTSSLSTFLIAGLLYGLGFGSVQPVLNALVISFAPAERRGSANATFLAASDIGLFTGALTWGLISQYFGFVYLYLISPILILISTTLYLTLLKPKVNYFIKQQEAGYPNS